MSATVDLRGLCPTSSIRPGRRAGKEANHDQFDADAGGTSQDRDRRGSGCGGHRVPDARRGVFVAATKTTVTDVVTAADRAVERQVLDALATLRPDDSVLGEEYGGGAAGEASSGVRWIVDPIDGTVNYLYGLPYCAVSLAAEVDGEVVAGVVRNLFTGEEWTATVGGGAWRAGSGCAARPRPTSARRWSPPGSATTRGGGRTRPGCSPS